MSLPAKYKLILTTPTGMRSEESGTISPERYAVLCGVLGGKLPDDLEALTTLDEENARLYRERDQALAERDRATELLAKYRQHVLDCEHIDYLGQIGESWSSVVFTPAEVAALTALRSKEVPQ